ncbi:MAG: hypothetical protein FWG85_00035 [Bacteroidetes bacterium]|nr:hypothetical protein [Bacteroidota bacterium]
MLIEVFKSGSHTDSNGVKTTYSLEQINQIVNSYNQFVAEHPNDLAPLVKGHPKNDAPAYGWVKRLVKKNSTIFADIEDIDATLIEDIKKKKFKNFSVALYPDLLLRHIGILGAVPPAVKGLNKNGIAYFHNDLEYNEYRHCVERKSDAKSPNETISKETISTENSSDKTYTAIEIDALTDVSASISAENNEIQKLKDINALLINKLHSLEKQSFLSSIQTFAESICSSPNSPVALSQKDVLIDILEHCYDVDKNNISINDIENYSFAYSENQNGLTAKIKKFVSNLSTNNKELCSPLELKEYSNDNAFEEFIHPNAKLDLEKNELHKKILNYIASHPDMSYSDALNNVVFQT